MLPVDGPVPREMVAAVPSIRRDPLAYLEGTVARYGDLVAFPMPRTPALLVNTPSAAHRVLVANHRSYSKRTVQYGALSTVTGAGLLTSDGETWRRSRRVAQPAFHHGSLERVARETAVATDSLLARWLGAGGVVDVEEACLQATMSLVGRTLFASELGGRGDELVQSVLAALTTVVRRARTPLPVPGWLPTPGNRALAQANRALDDVCAAIVHERRVGGPPGDQDLLGLLLEATDAGVLSPAQVRNELVTMVIAGHETVASSLAWTLHLLAGHPQAQDALHAEAAALPGGRAPQWDDLPRLPWTRAVVDESLRLYPPAWVVSRRALVDDVLDGVPLPAGSLVVISPWLLHRRETDFPDPGRFAPERFVTGDDTFPEPPRGAYLPFGEGPRLCIGRDVALVESVLVLAGLLARHRVSHVDGTRAEPEALVTLRPRGGLRLRLEAR